MHLIMASSDPEVVRVFALLGDSNISGHINKTSCSAHPSLKSAQVLSCGNLGIFFETLEKLKPDINVCLVACLTNFLTDSEGSLTISLRIQPVLQQIRSVLVEFCSRFLGRMYLFSPPMYRSAPTWYREGLPEVLTLFSEIFSSERPGNLHLLSSFATPEYEADGVHLTAYSGLEYILHLFESSHVMITLLETSLDDLAVKSCESTRVLEDRMMALQQDHRRLIKVVKRKSAADAELADFQQNERFEDSFLISGLSRISSNLVGKPWQEQSARDVQAVLTTLMGREYNILFIQNATSRVPDSIR